MIVEIIDEIGEDTTSISNEKYYSLEMKEQSCITIKANSDLQVCKPQVKYQSITTPKVIPQSIPQLPLDQLISEQTLLLLLIPLPLNQLILKHSLQLNPQLPRSPEIQRQPRYPNPEFTKLLPLQLNPNQPMTSKPLHQELPRPPEPKTFGLPKLNPPMNDCPLLQELPRPPDQLQLKFSELLIQKELLEILPRHMPTRN